MTRIRTFVCATLAGAALLSACGGGGSGESDGPLNDTVPPSATASPEALARWAGSRPETDTREPLSLDGVELPTSETAEPEPVER